MLSSGFRSTLRKAVWRFSREQCRLGTFPRSFWGTPLNIWVNDETGALEAPSSMQEILKKNPRAFDHFDAAKKADPSLSEHLRVHKPWINQVTWTNPGEAGTYKRVTEVIDCWFDSGWHAICPMGFPSHGSRAISEKLPCELYLGRNRSDARVVLFAPDGLFARVRQGNASAVWPQKSGLSTSVRKVRGPRSHLRQRRRSLNGRGTIPHLTLCSIPSNLNLRSCQRLKSKAEKSRPKVPASSPRKISRDSMCFLDRR